jgi:competence protein CoiA
MEKEMPFIALDTQTNQRIDITTIEQPRLLLKKEHIVCQLCHKPMLIKAGMIRQAHFAHIATTCTTEYGIHPESQAHRDAKVFLAEHLRTAFKEYTHAVIDYEVPIPEVKRVADLLVTFPTGWRVAHEVQLATITCNELQQRTDDYERAGIDVVWWLGKSANTEANRTWCEKTFGYALTIYEPQEL